MAIFTGTSSRDFIMIYDHVLSEIKEGKTVASILCRIKPPYDRSNFTKSCIIAEVSKTAPEEFGRLQLWVGSFLTH